MSPAPAACEERQRLVEAFTKAVSEYLRMRSAQIAAVKRGDGFLFDREIENAQQQKDSARNAIELHRLRHGC